MRKQDRCVSMKPQTTALINRETTGRDVDKWMEDLFARIQLCVLHPHSVIHQDGTAGEEETRGCVTGRSRREHTVAG